MLMDVITSPRGSARCGKEWSCRAESIFALKGINLKILHSEAVHCYMGHFETYILPIIFFMYGGILSLTYSYLYHYWHFPTMVGFCHGGNVLGNHDKPSNLVAVCYICWWYSDGDDKTLKYCCHLLYLLIAGAKHQNYKRSIQALQSAWCLFKKNCCQQK